MDATVNGALRLTIPDSFSVMSREDLRQAYLDDSPDRWGAWDKESHMVFSVFWHISNGLLVKLAEPNSVAKNTEKRLSKGMKDHGYVLKGFSETTVAGRKAPVFAYEYSLEGHVYVSDVTVIMEGKTCYTIYRYSRKDCMEANMPVLDAIRDSVSL
ncbi:hypothetical protein AUP07_0387 [methanogenic archaeon mixed culture ISO4-G1]|nr:hypothetical protein AUP07_0387 [methanogenic archaeon mixed culture ISO4-G1]